MNKKKIDPLALDREDRQRVISDLQAWFLDERGERIGDLAADLLVEFFQEKAARHWYNRGVQDAQAVARDRLERLADDLDLLKR
jgi:uncharacterized protein (DUF2164 family)